MPVFNNTYVSLYHADARHLPIPDNSVDCVVTSPPYFGLRDYQLEGEQIGLESTPDLYVQNMVKVFREVWRVLKPTGTVWLNLGDSYSSGSRTTTTNDSLRKGTLVNVTRTPVVEGIKPKDLMGMPWRVAFALQADGWYLRSDIIWSKNNPMPESVQDRPTKAHEYIFLLTKSPKYYYDADAIREPHSPESLPRALRGTSEDNKWVDGAPGSTPHTMSQPRSNQRKAFESHMAGGGSGFVGHSGYISADGKVLLNPLGRNKRSVWEISTHPYPEAHFATFPEKLVEPCIMAGCPLGGVVLDPFVGSGTTMAVAQRLNRKGVGTDLSTEYLALASKRLGSIALPMNLGI